VVRAQMERMERGTVVDVGAAAEAALEVAQA
jgi:hypothetical protein